MTHWHGITGSLGRPLLALAVLGILAAGCGPGEPKQAAAPPADEVRGEPIRGEPIAPAPDPGPALASVTNVPPAAGQASTPAPPPPPATATAATPGPVRTGDVAVATGAGQAAAPALLEGPAAGAGTSDSPMTVGFEKLGSFQYTLPDGPVDTNAVVQAQASSQIPDTIKGLNNRFVSLKGFMLPLKVEKGLVTELLVMRDQSMCCYGTVPRINEWVSVKMVGAGVKPIMDQAVTFVGKLKVGEMYENGYLVGIYALDGERMTGPLDM